MKHLSVKKLTNALFSKCWIGLLITLVIILIYKCVTIYLNLSCDLQSVHDEGFFYIILKNPEILTVYTQPLSLGSNILLFMFPSIENMDVLELRRLSYGMKLLGLIILAISAYIYTKNNSANSAHTEDNLVLAICMLIMGIFVLPSEVVNTNDELLFFSCLMLSFSLLYVSCKHILCRIFFLVLFGIISVLAILCNAPGGGIFMLFCGLFLLFYDGFSWEKMFHIAIPIAVGMCVSFVIVHYKIISISDIIEFIQVSLSQSSVGGAASHHSFDKIILVALFGIRDLIITTIQLCGLLYIYKLFVKMRVPKVVSIVLIVILLTICIKWMVKPAIQFANIIAWVTLLFFLYMYETKAKLQYNHIWLILLLFILPLGASFGTNTNLLSKSLQNIAPWGILLYMLYLNTKKLDVQMPRIMLTCFVLYVFVTTQSFSTMHMFLSKENDKLNFTTEEPIAKMHLNINQANYYNEVHDVLKNNGYIGGKDTLLGFCFNEMTVVAMNAIPYTNDQLPEEFLRHDLTFCPPPKYMILSEWDSLVLFDKFSTLDWDFPKGYNCYKCICNPDPNSGYNWTQSMIYCRQ